MGDIVPIHPQTREDEKTWDMIQAAFAETDMIMTERGWTADDIDREYLRRAIERLWRDEDRDALRAKVLAAASIEVNGLFDAIEEHPPAPSGDDPVG